ncbi:hypothetical protein EW145_g4576 [Phellinidium pouzarii]|uniref:CBM21 domain-containing protein n=1 Tax=Phellinidium pouzarii TaxID=167371 RepID=A0A4S4L4U9_9AGAM|nr:hypothetical protein EW145_g4576 [Phellinidium pouzarii]
MPYARPPSSPEAASYDLPPLKLRPKHRRTRSASSFSDERGPGAFVSLPNLPRRKSNCSERKTLFHFNDQDSDESDDDDDANALQLTVDTKKIAIQWPRAALAVRAGDLLSAISFPWFTNPIAVAGFSLFLGQWLAPAAHAVYADHLVQREASQTVAQVVLLLSALSDAAPSHARPVRACNSVRVKVFNSSGKPVNVSRANSDETETETEYDSSNPVAEQPGLPSPSPSVVTEEAAFELDPKVSSQIPATIPPAYANVHVESLILPKTRPPMLHGSILVRNVAFTKEIAIRFTCDNWNTTSEVWGKHVASLPSLPPPFPTPTMLGDLASATATSWDRFSFVIQLEDFERKLHEKTMWMVVRYTSPGVGEWWDNNEGKNYRIGFKRAGNGSGAKVGPSLVAASSRLSPVTSHSQQRTFSAPSTLKGTPTTEAVQTTAHRMQVPATSFALPSIQFRQHRASEPPGASPPPRLNSSPQPTLSSMGTVMRASAPSKLNFPNHSAPSTSSPLSWQEASPGARFADSPSAMSTPTASSKQILLPLKQMSHGLPVTAPRPDFSWPPSNNSSSQSLADTTPPPSYTTLPVTSDAEREHGQGSLAPSSSALASDSSYAAFVKHWCFVQSPTPSPSQTPSMDDGSTSRQLPQAAGNAWRGMGMEQLGGLYGNGLRSDSPMLTSM